MQTFISSLIVVEMCHNFHEVTVDELIGHKRVDTTCTCRAHNEVNHHFFLNYRSANEPDVAEILYNALASVKDYDVISFWDKKCLNLGQDWELEFMRFLTTSKIIILLLSHKTLEEVMKAAPFRQDNALVEYPHYRLFNRFLFYVHFRYELALLLKFKKGLTVIPILIGEKGIMLYT